MDTLSLYCYDWTRAESYGRIACELADGLEALGCYVNRLGPNAPHDKPIRMTAGGIALGYPTKVEAYGGLFKTGPSIWITMFESDTLPWLWADVLNESDAVIVPSRWLVNVFQEAGVEVPVTCLPLGISEVFQPVQRPPNRPFTVLAIADRGKRKAWDAAGFAFQQAFGEDPAYRMIFKARKHSMALQIANANMTWINKDMTDHEMVSLYRQADVMLFPGREGFGLPPREFAATGGTSIALNWGGNADELSQWGLPIATAGMEDAWGDYPGMSGIGQWAVPDIDDMTQTLKHVAAHRDYYAARGMRAAQFVHQTYDWSQFARSVYAVWEEACGKRTLRAAV